MKKLFLFLVMMSLLVGFGACVLGDNTPQGAVGSVAINMTLSPTPNPLDFGSLVPGATNDQVSNLASVGSSNLEVTGISVSTVNGSVFIDSNVLFSLNNVDFYAASALTTIPIVINAGNSTDLTVRLHVPVGTHTGSFAGTITYTVMEP